MSASAALFGASVAIFVVDLALLVRADCLRQGVLDPAFDPERQRRSDRLYTLTGVTGAVSVILLVAAIWLHDID